LLVVAGEPSGDRAAARVIDELGGDAGASFGIGGEHLARSGVELLARVSDLTALGIGESLGRLGAWLRAWASLREAVQIRRPRVALLVDTPEVGLPLARVLSADGVRVVYYVGPQVWAWRSGRLGLLGDRVDVVALVLPFEVPLYQRASVRAEFVGHPVLDEEPGMSRADVLQELALPGDTRLVAMLPGSRRSEVARLARPMIDAGARLVADRVALPVLAPGPVDDLEPVAAAARASGLRSLPPSLTVRDLLAAADAALVASGTATLEAAVELTPMAIVYRLGPLSWLAGRLLVDVPYVGLPSWIAGRQVVPELLQDQVTAAALDSVVRQLLDPAEQQRQRVELDRIRASLGGPGAAARVAALVRERLR
jgi:lipid-A-disaccharide synthase